MADARVLTQLGAPWQPQDTQKPGVWVISKDMLGTLEVGGCSWYRQGPLPLRF